MASRPLRVGAIEAAYAQPLYLDLNGPQSSEKYHFTLEVGTSF